MRNQKYDQEIASLRNRIAICEKQIAELQEEIIKLESTKTKLTMLKDQANDCKLQSMGKISDIGVITVVNPKIARNIRDLLGGVVDNPNINNSIVGIISSIMNTQNEIKERQEKIRKLRAEIRNCESMIARYEILSVDIPEKIETPILY